MALLRMAPTRFESQYKKIYNVLSSESSIDNQIALKALYYLVIKNAKIQNISNFLKEGDMKEIIIL